MKIYQIEFKD